METQENIVVEDSSESMIRNETKYTLDDNDKPFYDFIEKQAKEFEELFKQMSLNLQNSYKEYFNQQNDIIKVENDSIGMEEVCKKCEEKINSQSQLIDSLRTRIEELEIDSIIKNQDIKKLGQEFNDLKKEAQSVLATPIQDIVSNENVKDLEIPESNDQISDGEENSNLKKLADECHYDGEESNQQYFGYNYHQQYSGNERSRATLTMYDHYNNYNWASMRHNSQSDNDIEQNSKQKQKETCSLIPIVNVFIKNRQIHNRVTATLNNLDKDHLYHLFNEFKINDLLEYERSALFNSLDNESKRCFKITLMSINKIS